MSKKKKSVVKKIVEKVIEKVEEKVAPKEEKKGWSAELAKKIQEIMRK